MQNGKLVQVLKWPPDDRNRGFFNQLELYSVGVS